jgi:hypothetical protein
MSQTPTDLSSINTTPSTPSKPQVLPNPFLDIDDNKSNYTSTKSTSGNDNDVLEITLTKVLKPKELSKNLPERIRQLVAAISQVDAVQIQIDSLKKNLSETYVSTQKTCEHDWEEEQVISPGKWKRSCKVCFFEQTNPDTGYKSIPVWEMESTKHV